MQFRGLAVLAALTLATPLVGVPGEVFAQAPARTASIAGELVDAGGRAMGNQTVELVRDNVVVRTGATSSAGVWAFAALEPADYVVRAVINGQMVGVRVSAVGGETGGVVLVAPAMATPNAQIVIAGFAGSLAGTATAAGVAAVTTATADISDAIVAAAGSENLLNSALAANVLVDTNGNIAIQNPDGSPASPELRQQVIDAINEVLAEQGSSVVVTGS